jgi:GTP-binding protein EngB required for normal cell division
MGLAIRDATLAPHITSVESLLTRIEQICAQFRIITANRQIESCQNLLQEEQFLDVAVFGQFKAGKSSFLNSLIGKTILPVGVTPVTTAITRLQYGIRERAVIHLFNGGETEVPLDSIESFTSESKNHGNEKNVELVEIELPALEKYAGLRFVDTPGLGSIFKYHVEISENWLPEIGIALLAISADRPFGENDLQLIRELRKHTPNIVLLLTKADLLAEHEQREVVDFSRRVLEKDFRETFPIFLYSSRHATKELKERLAAKVFYPLSRNIKEEVKHILSHKVQSLARSCLRYLEIALRISLEGQQERESLRGLVLDDKLNYNLIGEELSRIARENAHQTRVLILQRLETLEEPYLKRKLAEKLRQEMPSWKGNLWKLTRKYEDWIQENLTEDLARISQSDYRHFLGTLRKAHAGFSRSLDIFRTLLKGNVEKALGVKLGDPDWKIEINEPTPPDIKTSRAFDFHLDMIWFLIPMFLFRRFFEKHFGGQIPWEVQVNLARLASQWEDRINKTIEAMKNQALKYVQDELATIESLLSKDVGQTDEIRRAMQEVERGFELLGRYNGESLQKRGYSQPT